MKSAIVTIRGVSTYSQGRAHDTPELEKELREAYERRTWRNRLHVTKEGYVEIPGNSLALMLKDAAKYLAIQIPGKGKATYTKHFDAGIMVPDGIVLPVKAEDVQGEWFFVPSDGIPGSGKRVWKCFPCIEEWGGTFTVFVVDDIIEEDIFRRVLVAGGQVIGLGRFRPRNRGTNGRFAVDSIVWRDEAATMAALEA